MLTAVVLGFGGLVFLFIFFLAAPGLSCSMQDLQWWHVGSIVPCPGIKLEPPALGVQTLSPWTTRELPGVFILNESPVRPMECVQLWNG